MCRPQCPLCCKSCFATVDEMRESLIRVTKRRLQCPLCSDFLIGLDKFTIHLVSHTIETSDTKCISNELKQCDTAIVYNNGHQEFHPTANKPHNCNRCSLCFESEAVLQMHTQLLHSNTNANAIEIETSPHQCSVCCKQFKMRGSLRVHMRVVHGQEIPKVIAKIKGNLGGEPHQDDAAIQGGGDGATTAFAVEQPNTVSNQGMLQASTEKAWDCDNCGKAFTTKYFLKKHKRLHTGEMPYTCEICSRTFTFQQSYHKHLLYHSDDKPHVCSTCGRAFKELSTLHNHERIHSGEKPFKCETCGKCFRQRVSYLVHRRIHTGVMPYKCTACAKSFRYKVSQRTHKCPVQPPGIVVRQSGDLVQKLLLNSQHANALPASINDGDVDDDDCSSEGNLCLDQLMEESCYKLGICSKIEATAGVQQCQMDGNVAAATSSSFCKPLDIRIPSPSEKFANLCLYPSHNGVDIGVIPAIQINANTNGDLGPLETINEDTFKKLLYGDN